METELPKGLDALDFRTADAIALGVSRKRLRAPSLRTPHSGVRSRAELPADLAGRCRDLVPLLLPGQGFSHATAAGLWGLPLPSWCSRPDSELHVVSVASSREPRRDGVVGHSGPGIPLSIHRGVPVVRPLRAWIHCAETFEVDDLIAMGDALLSKWSPYGPARYLKAERLEAAVREAAGRRGAVRLREAFELCRPKVWSPKETELRLFIVRNGWREPDARNEKQYSDDGVYLGRPDLAYPSLRIAIEYEGDHHRTNARTFRTDIQRRERFADADWRVVRVTSVDLPSTELVDRFGRLLPRR